MDVILKKITIHITLSQIFRTSALVIMNWHIFIYQVEVTYLWAMLRFYKAEQDTRNTRTKRLDKGRQEIVT